MPRWLSDILTDYEREDYYDFKTSVSARLIDGDTLNNSLPFFKNGGSKIIDTAIVLRVWEIEK